MYNKQTLPTARGQETCAQRYSSLLPHTDDMPTSKAHTEQKGDGSKRYFAKVITVFVTERNQVLERNCRGYNPLQIKYTLNTDEMDLIIRFLMVIKVQGTVVASSVA